MTDKSNYIMDITVLSFEQTNKRLFILCILLIVLLFGSNIGWLVYENQFADAVTTVTQEVDTTDGGDAIVNGTGDLSYGTGETDNNN